MSTRNTARFPTIAASVSTCHRRLMRSTVARRKWTSRSGQPRSGPRVKTRRTRLTTLWTSSPRPARGRRSRHERQEPDGGGEDDRADHGDRRQQGVALLLDREQQHGDDGQQEVGELVPDAGSVGARHLARVEAPGAQQAVRPCHPHDAAAQATYVSAVEAWVNGSACRRRSPGRAIIHGGANVTMLRRRRRRVRAARCGRARRRAPRPLRRSAIRGRTTANVTTTTTRASCPGRSGGAGRSPRHPTPAQSRRDDAPRSTERSSPSGSRSAAKRSAPRSSSRSAPGSRLR